MGNIDIPLSFGEWIKRRRKELDLTLVELAKQAGCSASALRKIESGERRPSKQLAGLLARALEIPVEDQPAFTRVARGDLNLERLRSPAHLHSIERISNPSPGNLPEMITPFVGREMELAAIGQLLCDPQCRLLTLTGPGGIGKTRLSIEAASQCKVLFPDGAWFVSLASLSSPSLLVVTIGGALNIRFQDLAKPSQQVLEYLHDKRALLVLDNVEHLLDGAGFFLDILGSCPQVKLMVTSRENLNLMSEWVFEIQGLPVPDSIQIDQYEAYSSVELFLQSARRIQPGFTVEDKERQWVVRICKIMEGMPLGIEMAAAWVRLLSCEEIATEIERNLDFLAVSMRDIPERHRSLRAMLDHSWNLLTAEEKIVLSRLSVFQGSFSREAAQEVCGANLMILSSLKNKSLLRRTERGRYDLHEIIKQYAALRLSEDPNEDEPAKDRHSLYYARRLSEWEAALKSSRQVEVMIEMEQEIDNLRLAWQRMVTCCNFNRSENNLFSLSLFHNSLFSLSLFYEQRCRNWEAVSLFRESVEALRAAKDSFDRTQEKILFETVLGEVTAYLGLHHGHILQYQPAIEYLKEGIRLLENEQAKVFKAQAQIMLAWIFHTRGQIRESAALMEESLTALKNAGDGWWYTLNLVQLARVYLSMGKIHESRALYQEGLQQLEPGDLRIGGPLCNGLAYLLYLENDYAEAERLFLENLERNSQLGNKRLTAFSYLDLGQVALATGRIELAEISLHESIDILSEFGESPDMASGLLHLGRCLLARGEIQAARSKFLQVIQIGQALDIFHLIYWGLVYMARIHIAEGKIVTALEMALVLQKYPVEIKAIQDDGLHLLADVQAGLSAQQVGEAVQRIEGRSIEPLIDLIHEELLPL